MNDGFTCLAIETATQNCSVAACRGSEIRASEIDNAGAQSRGLFSQIEQVLRESSLSLPDLDCVALGIGPGGFTGLRVAAAAAQALAFGSRLPVCRVSTLAALALGAARDSGAKSVAACLDARMGEAYIGAYRVDEAGLLTCVVADCLVDPASFSLPGSDDFHAAGPGWAAYPELAARHADRTSGADHGCLPSAIDTLSLARAIFRDGLAVEPARALPNYVRNTVTQRRE